MPGLGLTERREPENAMVSVLAKCVFFYARAPPLNIESWYKSGVAWPLFPILLADLKYLAKKEIKHI